MYYRTYSDTGLIRYGTYQIQNLSDTGLIRYKSTRRYYRTYSDTGLIRYRTYQIQEYPWVLQDLFRYMTYQIQEYLFGPPVGVTKFLLMQNLYL